MHVFLPPYYYVLDLLNDTSIKYTNYRNGKLDKERRLLNGTPIVERKKKKSEWRMMNIVKLAHALRGTLRKKFTKQEGLSLALSGLLKKLNRYLLHAWSKKSWSIYISRTWLIVKEFFASFFSIWSYYIILMVMTS